MDGSGRELARREDQRLTRAEIDLPEPAITDRLILTLCPTRGGCPPALFEIICL